MKKSIEIMFVFLIIPFLESPLFSQHQELDLPKNSFVNGISFLTYDQGIITTQDSSVFKVTINEDNEPQIYELNLENLKDRLSKIYFHYPFWVNDTTFGMVKTHYDKTSSMGYNNVLVSYDSGNSFQSIYRTDIDYLIHKIIVQSDSILYIGVTSDILNSIEILKCIHTGEKVVLNESYFVGNIYPEFTVIEQDIVLISSSTDSVHIYDFKNDSLATMKTNLEIKKDYALFYELATGLTGQLIGIRADGIYRSTDNGTNWTIVLPGEFFAKLSEQSSGYWWVMQVNNNEHLLWGSQDNALSWSLYFSVDSRFSVLEVVDPNWYWLGSLLVGGKVLYGQYKYLPVKYGEHSAERNPAFVQNYPNPFNSTTTIQCNINCSGIVRIDIYNIQGKFIRNLISRELAAGTHKVTWDGNDRFGCPVASGLVILKCSLGAGDILTRKIILLR